MGGQLRLRQVCIVAPDLDAAADDMAAILGLEVCHRDPNVATFGVENALFVAGTTFIEIIAPFKDGTAAGRFLERSTGRGGYIAIFDCLDPKARQAHALSLGVATAFTIDRPGTYQCVQLHPRDCRATMLEFDRSEGGDALTGTYWPAGGDGWQQHVDQRVTRSIRGIEAVSPDPADLARHWGSILERPVDDGPLIQLDGAHIRFQPSDDARERLDAIVLDAADGPAIMAAANERGKATGPDSFALCGMTFRIR